MHKFLREALLPPQTALSAWSTTTTARSPKEQQVEGVTEAGKRRGQRRKGRKKPNAGFKKRSNNATEYGSLLYKYFCAQTVDVSCARTPRTTDIAHITSRYSRSSRSRIRGGGLAFPLPSVGILCRCLSGAQVQCYAKQLHIAIVDISAIRICVLRFVNTEYLVWSDSRGRPPANRWLRSAGFPPSPST